MDESLNAGCTIHVLRRLRGGARGGGSGIGSIPGQWQCTECGADEWRPARERCYRCDQPRGTLLHSFTGGPPEHVPVSGAWLPLWPFPRGKESVVPTPAPNPGPSLGPSQASLMNALALLSNVLSPSEVWQVTKVGAPSFPCPSRWNPPMITLPWNLLPQCSTKSC